MPAPWMPSAFNNPTFTSPTSTPRYKTPFGIPNAKGFPTSGFGQPGGLPPGGTLGELPDGSSPGIMPGAPGQGQSVNYPNGWSVIDGRLTSGPGISPRGSTPMMTPAMQTALGGGSKVRTTGPAQMTGNPFPFGFLGGQNRSWGNPAPSNLTAPPPQQPPTYNPTAPPPQQPPSYNGDTMDFNMDDERRKYNQSLITNAEDVKRNPSLYSFDKWIAERKYSIAYPELTVSMPESLASTVPQQPPAYNPFLYTDQPNDWFNQDYINGRALFGQDQFRPPPPIHPAAPTMQRQAPSYNLSNLNPNYNLLNEYKNTGV